jgi:hypothetical protein
VGCYVVHLSIPIESWKVIVSTQRCEFGNGENNSRQNNQDAANQKNSKWAMAIKIFTDIFRY